MVKDFSRMIEVNSMRKFTFHLLKALSCLRFSGLMMKRRPAADLVLYIRK
jgi:hypothetical protein